MDPLTDTSKKQQLEDLPKEEIIQKYRALLNLLQKAKQSKDSITEENNELKRNLEEIKNQTSSSNAATQELLDSLTQQKLDLVTTLGDVNHQKEIIQHKLNDCESNLVKVEAKVVELDTENLSYKRQVQRLTEENEQLLSDLDSLEKQSNELKNLGLCQQQQLLELERNGDVPMECESVPPEESTDNSIKTNKELLRENNELKRKNEELFSSVETLKTNCKNAEVLVNNLKEAIEKKNKQNEVYLNTTDDLNIELHKNKALVEKLKQDIVTMSNKLSNSQIVSSGVASDLENTNEKLKDKLKLFRSKLVKFAGDVKVLKQQKTEILNNFKDYILQVKFWEAQLKEFSTKIIDQFKKVADENLQLQIENTHKHNRNTELSADNQTLVQKIEELKTLLQEESNSKADFNSNIQSLQVEIQSLKSNETKLKEELQNVVKENQQLLTNTSSIVTHVDTQTDNYEEDISIIKKENAELLVEMNEMNEALKERGETISKQQMYCEELMKNIKIFEMQGTKNAELVQEKNEIIKKLERNISMLQDQSQNCSVVELNELQEQLEKKNNEISQLQMESSTLKERLHSLQYTVDSSQDTGYAESDTMSTSTISRTEELTRLKDLEGSWEERYGKLRSLALKLKGKIRQLTGDLTKEQSEKADLQQKLTSSLRTTQSLQSQCDSVQDELDLKKKELKESMKKLDSAALEISNNKKQLADNEEIIAKFKSDLEHLNKEKVNMDNWKKQVSSKVQNLKKELEANAVLKKDYEGQIEKLNTQLEAKEKLLKEEIEKHNTTKSYLQESNNECKKQSVLNLEMQDYERGLKELTQKLEKKQELVNKLKNQIDSQKGVMNALKEQNRLLEESVQNEETELNNAKSEVRTQKKSIAEFENLLAQKDEKVQDLLRSLENCRVDNEDLSTQVSKLIAENKKTHDGLKQEKDHLRSQNLGLEQKLHEIQENLKLKEDELKIIQTEYQSYKVRAQSVLRQNQTRDVSLEERLSEEASSLRAQVHILTSKITELESVVEKSKEEIAKLETETDEAIKMHSNSITALEEQKSQYNTLSKKHQTMIADHAEVIRDLKVHTETLAQCYRQQLSDQEVRHNREVIELQSKMDKVPPVPDIPAVSPLSIPREQGEGSESTESVKLNTHLVPLDRLLSTESDTDIGFMKKQLNENETKVSHLTALLAETEQDLAKHVQMNKLLKEEIRRQQRSVEREKHAENLEYLKNVIFKFITLGGGDERSRLVPVLNTILKFSPDEISKLNTVAKGDFGGRGWSNYLPIWSPSSRPQ